MYICIAHDDMNWNIHAFVMSDYIVTSLSTIVSELITDTITDDVLFGLLKAL